MRLEDDIQMLNQSEADWIHCDVMDGIFVPNLSFGMPIIRQLKKITSKPLDVHLMITNPDLYLEAFADAGANHLTVHYETCPHLHRTVQKIKSLGLKAGVCLNPHTPVALLEDILPDLDLVLLMSVNPGFGGQKFITNTYLKVRKLKKMLLELNHQCFIEVDGGVNNDTGQQLIAAGANVLVSGSFIFGAPNPKKTIHELKFTAS